jgi:hypothetical protein
VDIPNLNAQRVANVEKATTGKDRNGKRLSSKQRKMAMDESVAQTWRITDTAVEVASELFGVPANQAWRIFRETQK